MTEAEIQTYRPFPTFSAFTAEQFDAATLEQFVNLLEKSKADSTKEQLQNAVQKATKWAAIDTGAIEGLYEVDRGFTYSIAAEAAAWDNLHQLKGQKVERVIQDAMEGYDYVLDVATQNRPISETWIKELHQVICASQDTYTVITAAGKQEHELLKGAYKKYANNPFNFGTGAVHAYAPVSDTAAEMHRMVEELNSKDFSQAHPLLQAAYAHYAFVCIHPFADGNGRVSRALASIYLYRSPGVPLVIFADQKPSYIDALEAADAGAYALFKQFVSDRAVDVVRMISADMKRRPRPTAEQRLADMNKSLLGRGGLPHEEIDALSSLLFDEFSSAIDRAILANEVRHPLGVRKEIHGYALAAVESFRLAPNSRTIMIHGVSSPPATAGIQVAYGCLIKKGQAQGPDFIIMGGSPAELVEEVLIRELTPAVTPALTYRLDAAAEEIILNLIDAVIAAGEDMLRQTGYRD